MSKEVKRDPCPRCGGVLKLKKGTKWVECTKGCGFTVSRFHRFSAVFGSKGDLKDQKKAARKAAKKEKKNAVS